MASGPITSWQIKGGKMETVTDFIFLGCKTLRMVTAAVKLRLLLLERKAMTNLDSVLKSRDFEDKGLYSQSYSFSSIHVWM